MIAPPDVRAAKAKVKAWNKEQKAARPKPAKTVTLSKVRSTPGAGTKRGHISLGNVAKLQQRQANRCAGCDRSLVITEMSSGYHVDHVTPLALGGDDQLANWQLLCIECHRAKTKLDVARIAKAKRQAKMMESREPPKRPIRSRGF